VRRVFRWGVKNVLIPPGVYEGLRAVEGVKPGRTAARETQPVAPVADDVIDATLAHLPPIVADMVRLQRLTGCRPAEVCVLRRCDVNRGQRGRGGKREKSRPLFEADVWEYRPASHKTEHLGHERVIFIGPKAQLILRPYLVGQADGHCFSPAESERRRRAELHAQRQTPLPFGNSPGTNRQASPRRQPGQRYTSASYRKAIHRACDLAFPPPAELRSINPELPAAEQAELRKRLKAWRKANRWSPNQIRHTAATDIRSRFGIEESSAVLGHKHLNTTEIYALADREKAAAIAREVG
jgi:integrase